MQGPFYSARYYRESIVLHIIAQYIAHLDDQLG